jgi:hypothetical protein
MATNDIDVQALRNAVNAMAKALGGNTGFSGAATGGRSSAYSSYKNDDNNEVDYDKLKRIMKNNGDVAQQILVTLKNVSKSNSKIADLYSDLEKSTRNQTDIQRKAALALADFLSKTKDVTGSLEKVSITMKKTNDSLKGSDAAIEAWQKAVARQQFLLKQMNDSEEAFIKKRKELEEKIAKQTAQKKGTTKTKEELADVMDEFAEDVKAYHEELDKNKKSLDALDESVSEIIKNFEDLDKITNTLTAAQKDQLKRYRDMTADQRKASGINDSLKESIEGLDGGTKIAADNIVKNSKTAGDSLVKAGQYALKFGKLLVAMVPGLVNDMLARDRYNVSTHDYKGDIGRGISEQERAQLIGTNRNIFRSSGGGDETKGFNNSAELQRTAHLFGVTGADAIKKVLETQQTSAGFGVSYGNIAAQKLQMTTMREMAKQIGVTDDELKDFYSSLQDMGQTAALSQKYADKNDIERSKAINKEIYERTRLNTALGISLEQQKQAQQAAVNQKYGGIESLIKGKIGGDILTKDFENNGGQLTARQKQLVTDNIQTKGAYLTGKDADDYQSAVQSIASQRSGRLQKAGEANSQGNYRPLAGEEANNAIYSSLGLDVQDFDVTNSKNAQQRKAQGENAVGNASFNDVLKSAQSSLDGPDGFTAAVYNATEALTGLKKSPVGDIAAFVGGAIAQYLGQKVVGKAAGWIAGKVAGTAGGAAAEGLAGTVAGGTVGKAAGLLAKAKGFGARGIAGGLAAYGINALYGDADTLSEGNDDLGSQALRGGDYVANAAMGSGFLPAMALGGTYKVATRAGNSIQKQLAKSSTFNDLSDVAFGSTIGGVQALFGGDKAGWNQAKSGAYSLSNSVRSLVGLDPLSQSTGTNNFVPPQAGQTPNQTLNNQIMQQAQQALSNGDADKATKLLESIAKSNAEMNSRDDKDAQQKAAEQQANIGSAYSEYAKHLDGVFGSVSHGTAA